jgi:hypothetical protein
MNMGGGEHFPPPVLYAPQNLSLFPWHFAQKMDLYE